MIPPIRMALLCIGLLVASPAAAMTMYGVDDGTSETAVGHGASGYFLWGNYFNAVAGGRTISQIEIAFANFSVPVGRAYTALLYDDLDDDGDPTSGLVLVASLAGTVVNPQPIGANTFEVADIADTLVSGGFFIAVYMDGTGNPFPAPFDQTSNSGQSWFAEHNVIGALDVNDPFGSATLSGEPRSACRATSWSARFPSRAPGCCWPSASWGPAGRREPAGRANARAAVAEARAVGPLGA